MQLLALVEMGIKNVINVGKQSTRYYLYSKIFSVKIACTFK